MIHLLILTADAASTETRNLFGLRTLGPSKISWIARKHGYNSITLSRLQLLSEEEIIELAEPLVNEKTIIGISTSFFNPLSLLSGVLDKNNPSDSVILKIVAAVDILRAKYNNTVIVGGSIGKFYGEIFKADESFNGGAENSIVQYLDKHFRYGIQKHQYDWNIQNCSFRWHESDCIQNKEVLPLEIARGCIFKCKFCDYSEIGKRAGTYERNMSHIKDELLYNYEKYNTKYYWLASDTFNDNNDRMNEWCDMLESLPFKIQYSCFLRLDLAYKYLSTTKRLYDSGLKGAHFGVETFHPQAAKSIGKSFNGVYGQTALETIFYDTFESNVATTTTMIVGLPYETVESIKSAVDWYSTHKHINVHYIPLSLLNKKLIPEEKLRSNEFSRNIQNYDYVFEDNELYNWQSPVMNYSSAKSISHEIATKLNNYDSLNSWFGMIYMALSDKSPQYFFENGANLVRTTIRPMISELNNNYIKLVKNYILQL